MTLKKIYEREIKRLIEEKKVYLNLISQIDRKIRSFEELLK